MVPFEMAIGADVEVVTQKKRFVPVLTHVGVSVTSGK